MFIETIYSIEIVRIEQKKLLQSVKKMLQLLKAANRIYPKSQKKDDSEVVLWSVNGTILAQ